MSCIAMVDIQAIVPLSHIPCIPGAVVPRTHVQVMYHRSSYYPSNSLRNTCVMYPGGSYSGNCLKDLHVMYPGSS